MIKPDTLFSTPIWRLPMQEAPTEALEWALKFKEKNPSVQKSNKGGYQSTVFPFEDFPYNGHIQEGLSNIFESFKVQAWWLNVNEKGDYNWPHTHPSSDIAVIWYLTDNYGKLIMEDPMLHTRSNIIKFYHKSLSGCRSVDAKAGEIIAFPADVSHFVDPHTLDTPRVCVSMNIELNAKTTINAPDGTLWNII